jgi:hypothetical protein
MTRNSGFATLAVLSVLVAVAIGVQRFGFQAANKTANLSNNSTPAQLQQVTGTIVELLPLLVLVAGAVVFVSALDLF